MAATGILRDGPIGFIGLGLMGAPMCRNLQAAGARLVLYNRSAAKAKRLARKNDVVASTPRDVAEQAKIVILMLADTRAVQQTLFGRNGVSEGLRRGSQVVDMGTTDVLQTRQFGKWVAEAGASYVDAPVSGGEIGAKAGSLTIMAGGSRGAIAKARPIFAVLGDRFTHVGAVGAGQVAKAANQVIVGLTIGAVAEALGLAAAAGVDPAKVRTALEGGFAASRILEVHGERMIKGRFKPGGKAQTQRKDIAQALTLAKAANIDLPATKLNLRLYDQLIKQGGGELDHSALYKLFVKHRQ